MVINMRELLFRGQTRKYGQYVNMAGEKLPGNWVYGGIFQGTGDYSIIYGAEDEHFTGIDLGKHVVYSDTVGQYTGMKDINGKKIFEGDIVRTQPFSDRPYSKKAKYKQHIGVVEYYVGHFKSIHDGYEQDYESIWRVKINDYEGYGCCNWSAFFKCEVIGNIHDNPELLEVQND